MANHKVEKGEGTGSVAARPFPHTPTFKKIHEEKRGRMNAQFAEARLANPALDGAAVLECLETTIAPAVDAVAAVRAERADPALEALYPLALALLGQDLLGAHTRDPLIGEGWRALLPVAARQLAEAPETVAGALTNALFNLSRTPGVRGREWIANLSELAPRCAEMATLLKVGQVLAWRAGLAQYRTGALALCAQLDPTLARAALGVPAGSRLDMAAILKQLADDPWLNPAALDGRPRQVALRIVARVGAFRGFDGPFIAPPTVSAAGEALLVTDGEGTWQLTADVFGATFHRVTPTLRSGQASDGGRGTGGLGAWKVERGPKVTLGPLSATFRELPDISSSAAVGQTLAVTTALSHAVYLIAAT